MVGIFDMKAQYKSQKERAGARLIEKTAEFTAVFAFLFRRDLFLVGRVYHIEKLN